MKRFFAIVFFVLFCFPLLAKEDIVFESILKDAIFVPCQPEKYLMAKIEGYWTLKFENGAIVSIGKLDVTEGESLKMAGRQTIWWIGETYRVTRGVQYLEIRLIKSEE